MELNEQQIRVVKRWLKEGFYPPVQTYNQAQIKQYLEALVDYPSYGEQGQELLNELRSIYLNKNKK